jgi:hypothetical protein
MTIMATNFFRSVRVQLISTFLLIPSIAVAAHSKTQSSGQDQQKRATTASGELAKASGPAFTEYRGVRIGMSATEVREKLGKPRVKDKTQDLFVFTDNESAQIFYDEQENVYAISIDFKGRNNDAPTVREVLNEDVAAKADGSMYQMKQYSNAGYWVSYNRTSSDPPQVTITMQKLPQ